MCRFRAGVEQRIFGYFFCPEGDEPPTPIFDIGFTVLGTDKADILCWCNVVARWVVPSSRAQRDQIEGLVNLRPAIFESKSPTHDAEFDPLASKMEEFHCSNMSMWELVRQGRVQVSVPIVSEPA